MSIRRTLFAILAVAAVLLLAALLYLAFGNLSRHKPSIESLVSEGLGRPFAIDGAFELEILPRIAVRAERVRLGNAPWGAAPQMVEVGRFAAEVGLWSLLFGPVDIRSFELRDVTVVLEMSADGKVNWAFGAARDAADPGAGDAELREVPAVVLNAKLANVRVAYREHRQPERAVLLETFTIASKSDGMLVLAGKGTLDGHAARLAGEVGPLAALFTGRDMRAALEAGLAGVRLDLKGRIGRLDPLDGADLALAIGHPDAAALLKDLKAPAFAAGPLRIDATLKDAGERTRFDAVATLGEIAARADGTLRSLGLPGAELRFEAVVPDAARVAVAFGAAGVPAGALEAGGRVEFSEKDLRLEGAVVQLAGAKATADGTVRAGGESDLRFAISAESLARLRPGLPNIAFALRGGFAGGRDQAELRDVSGRLGGSAFTARASAALAGQRRIEAELAAPVLDLTPFLANDAAAAPQPKKAPKRKYVFDDEPLPLDALKGLDARLHASIGELRLEAGGLKEVDARLAVADGGLAAELRARGGVSGSLAGKLALAPRGRRGAALELDLSAAELRAGIGAGQGVERGEVPAVGVEAKLKATGASARQLAAGADGHLVATVGPGKVKSGVLALVGGDLLGELAGKLNPFVAQDPYTQFECAVVRADIAGGEAKLAPLVMQTAKVAVIASGTVDLRTEALRLEFDTRPRQGVGISAGMFTNPFIELAGTLANPRLGASAKSAVAGAAAAATGGMTVLAQGLWDRLQGAQDLCPAALEAVGAAAK